MVMVSKRKKVFVSGCFDMLHSGHVAFLDEVSQYGDLYVGLGSDRTIFELKGRHTINSEDERMYMLKALKSVTNVFINSGGGLLDFEEDLIRLKADIFIVNEDGHSYDKVELCEKVDIEYKVLKRIPYANLPSRSTTTIRNIIPMPYRIDLAGTWIDQPYVSKQHPGWAITASIEPIIEFNERSGMATSTRNKAIELWNNHLPFEYPEKLAKILFRYDNNPGTKEVSGSQDSIGITMPGINRFFYEKGEYWPSKFESVTDKKTVEWLEERLYMIPLWPRPDNFKVLAKTNITANEVLKLTEAAEKTWKGLTEMDINIFAEGFFESFNSQIRMFPLMLNDKIERVIDKYRDTALAWKLSGAGGGGYLILISEMEITNAIRVKVRIKELGL